MPVVLVATYVLRRVRQHAGAEAQPFIDVPVQAQLEVVLRQTRQIIAAGYADFVVRTAALARGAVVLGKQARRRAEGGVQVSVIQPPVDRPLLAGQAQLDALSAGAPEVGEVPHAATGADEQQVVIVHAAEGRGVPARSASQLAAHTDFEGACHHLLQEGIGGHGVGQAAGVLRIGAAEFDGGRRAVALGEAAIQGHSRLQFPGEAERRVQFAIGEVTIERVPHAIGIDHPGTVVAQRAGELQVIRQ